MMKGWFKWLAAAASLGLTVCVSVWQVSGPHPVNRANFERIQVGMTQAEVEAILGCPPGDYATVDYLPEFCGFMILGATVWVSNDGDVRVWFDNEGRVEQAYFFELLVRRPPSLLDRVRAWVGW